MRPTENGQLFLSRVCDLLLSLPFDLKVLQEVITDVELPQNIREQAASVLVHAFGHQDGSGPERFLEDVFLLRIAFGNIAADKSEEADRFRSRFDDIFGTLDDDLTLFSGYLGSELWNGLRARAANLGRLVYKGKRPAQYVADEASWDELYEDGLEFQTAYNVSEEQVKNRLRRPEPICEAIQKRTARPK
ncbi:MAG TPA: hypothetical protein PKI49_01495 [Pseudomonadota bacterium]|jgi:hypothetical protein|nr:hypothetical protein [Pseudomonadota bacterium]HNI58450.1 hypothetical protein [Pseudomonadota bacterium]HNN53406.1 hypothetical protein [Pseudomonadota bacterium]HNO67155.1 hypothetical protein [Pseudomonadota bacterium]